MLPRLLKRLAAGAAALAVIAPAAAQDDANTLNVRLDWLPNGYHAPYHLGIEKGWFAKAGLKVSVSDGTGSATTVQLVGTGQVDVGHAALSNMAVGRSKGLPVIAFAGVFRKSDMGLIVPNDSPIRAVKDLRGRTILYAAGSFEGPFMDVFIALGGLSRSDTNLLNVDPQVKTSTYIAGRADGMMGSPPTQLPLVAGKRDSRALAFGDIGLVVPGSGLVATEATLKRKGDAIRKFASIVAGGWTYILSGKDDEAVKAIIAQRPQAKLDPAIIAAQLKEARAYLFTPATEKLPFGFQAESDWQAGLATLEKVKMIEPGWKAREYFTNDYLDRDLIRQIGGS